MFIMKKNISVRTIAFVGVLGALSAVLMLVSFPLPFAPIFMKFDVSDIPGLFAGFFLGPTAGCWSLWSRSCSTSCSTAPPPAA